MSSWKALAWAKDQAAGSALGKVVLLLLAERADERYSCYPSLGTLAAEAEAQTRSIRRILRSLEQRGLITTVARKRESGVSTSNRYFINHPEAPHVRGVSSAYGEIRPGGPEVRVRGTTGPGHPDARSVPPGHEDRVRPGHQVRTMNNPPEHPTDQWSAGSGTGSAGSQLLASLAADDPRLRLAPRDISALTPLVDAALGRGWTAEALGEHLRRSLPATVSNPYGLIRSRLSGGLPLPPRRRPPLPPECGQCDNRWLHLSDGKVAHCPRCHPAAQAWS